jgi:hypothetical protein
MNSSSIGSLYFEDSSISNLELNTSFFGNIDALSVEMYNITEDSSYIGNIDIIESDFYNVNLSNSEDRVDEIKALKEKKEVAPKKGKVSKVAKVAKVAKVMRKPNWKYSPSMKKDELMKFIKENGIYHTNEKTKGEFVLLISDYVAELINEKMAKGNKQPESNKNEIRYKQIEKEITKLEEEANNTNDDKKLKKIIKQIKQLETEIEKVGRGRYNKGGNFSEDLLGVFDKIGKIGTNLPLIGPAFIPMSHTNDIAKFVKNI